MIKGDFKTVVDVPMALGESPLWHPRESALYWVDISASEVHRLEIYSGVHRVYPVFPEPACIVRKNSGGLLVASRAGIFHLNTVTGSVELMVDAPYDTSRLRFNDGRCDQLGRLWVGSLVDKRNTQEARLYSFEQGQIKEHLHPVTVSNGVAFSPDAKTLYHSDTTAHSIYAYDFNLGSGITGQRRILRQFSSVKNTDYTGRPDGAAVDSEGAYWVAMYEGGRILRLAPNGNQLFELKVPMQCPTMIAFGGSDLKTLYITSVRQNRSDIELTKFPASGCVISIEIEIAGLEEYAYRD